MIRGMDGYETLVGAVIGLIGFAVIAIGFAAWEIWNDG